MTANSDRTEDTSLQMETTLPVRRLRRQRQGLQASSTTPVVGPRIPRITRLMALAIKFQDMVDNGEVSGYADLARLGYVSRARLTQIMNLLLLSPGLQEHLLFNQGGAAAQERTLRAVTRHVLWDDQRRRFDEI